jgi:hypothetical protein
MRTWLATSSPSIPCVAFAPVTHCLACEARAKLHLKGCLRFGFCEVWLCRKRSKTCKQRNTIEQAVGTGFNRNKPALAAKLQVAQRWTAAVWPQLGDL